MTEQARSEEAKALLKDIIDAEHQAYCSLVTSHAGTLLVLNVSYEDACKKLEALKSADDLNTLTEWETFVWVGTRNAKMQLHRKSIRVGWIIEIVEITDEQWEAIVTDQVARQTQQAMQRLQG